LTLPVRYLLSAIGVAVVPAGGFALGCVSRTTDDRT
jgi:hypothetical protein